MTACRSTCTNPPAVAHHHSWLTSPGLITTDRWIGLAVALAGIVITSDGAAIRQAAAVYRAIRRRVVRGWTQTKAIVAKMRGGRRLVIEASSVLSRSSGMVTVSGRSIAHIGWDPISSSTAKIEALHSHVTALQRQLEAAQQRIANIERTVEQHHTETTTQLQTLERRVDDANRRDRRLNELGLIPIAIGLLLTAAPDDALSAWGHPSPGLDPSCRWHLERWTRSLVGNPRKTSRALDGITA